MPVVRRDRPVGDASSRVYVPGIDRLSDESITLADARF
jgi:hypothetical protein